MAKLKQLLRVSKAGLVLASFLLLYACSDSVQYQQFSGSTMGTHYHITAQLPKNTSRADVEKAIAQRLEAINHSMSTWRENSLISQFNRASVGDKVQVDKDFIHVLQISRDVNQASSGAFNPAIGALVELWGFGPKMSIDQMQHIPSDEAILAAQKQSDLASVKNVDLTLNKQAPLHLDFSGVAKGYGVDVLATVMDDFHAENYMVEIGGEIAVKGVSAKGVAWRIGIESPENIRGKVITAVHLSQGGMATSGDYRNFFNYQGKRYSHTIDPRTGRPVTHHLASVTVIAQTVALADAWATAFTVLGEENALALAEKLDMAIYTIRYSDGAFISNHSSKMQSYLQ